MLNSIFRNRIFAKWLVIQILLMSRFVYCAIEIGYFLLYSSNWMKIYIITFKLIKFKLGNTTDYTLKQDFKSEID
jgi:hypothetical protein